MTKTEETLYTNPGFLKEREYQVVLFDCNCHSFDEVVFQLTKAVGCSDAQAVQYAKLAEQFGCAAVFTGSHAECNRVTTVLTAAGLRAEVQ